MSNITKYDGASSKNRELVGNKVLENVAVPEDQIKESQNSPRNKLNFATLAAFDSKDTFQKFLDTRWWL